MTVQGYLAHEEMLPPVGPYILGGWVFLILRGWLFLISEVPLYS